MVKGTRRKKPARPRTIDLEAREVKEESASKSSSAKPSAGKITSGKTVPEVGRTGAEKKPGTQSGADTAKKPVGEKEISSKAEDAGKKAENHTPPSASMPSSSQPERKPKTSLLALLGSAVLGAGIALAGAGALNQAGLLGYVPFASGLIYSGGADGDETQALKETLGSAEARIAELSAQIEALRAADNDGTIAIPEEIAGRIEALEKGLSDIGAASQPDSGENARLDEAVNAVKNAEKLAESANQKVDEALANVSELSQKILSGGGLAGGGPVDSETIRAALAAETSALNEKLAALEAEMKANGQGAAANPELLAEIEKLSAAVSALSARVEEIEALPEKVGTLGGRLEELNSGLTSRMESVETRLQQEVMAPMAEVQKAAEAALAGQKMARAVNARALNSVLKQGGKFAGELATAEAMLGPNEVIAELKPLASSGLQTPQQLAESFEPVANAIAATENQPDKDAGVLAKFMSNAKSLVKVRPAGPQEGSSATAIASRVEGHLKSGQLGQARQEWESLPEEAKALSADWIMQLDARLKAEALIGEVVEMLSGENKS